MFRSAIAASARAAGLTSTTRLSGSSFACRRFHAAPLSLDRILIVDGIEPVCAQILRDAGHEVDEAPKLPAADLLTRIGDYHGLIVRSETKVTVRPLVLNCAAALSLPCPEASSVPNCRFISRIFVL